MLRSLSCLTVVVSLAATTYASQRGASLDWLAGNEAYLVRVAGDLEERAEPAHYEVRTSTYLQDELRLRGFEVEGGIAGLPTSFVASYGTGKPIIGMVALLDALPGTDGAPAWHGCGHHLIGAADLGAVLAVREAMAADSLAGTIRLYGAPAEEIYHGGVYMVREGAFDDLDALLFWHPSSITAVIGRSGLAMDSVRFVFRGRASDATDAPEKGRNALAAAYDLADRTRSGWPRFTVVNHVLLEGGVVPSVVPDLATIWYFMHGPDRTAVDEIRERIASFGDEAARRTGTEVEVQLLSSTRHWLINRRLSEHLQSRLEGDVLPLSFGDEPVLISDDTAEASWVVPRAGFLVQAFPAGTPSHSREWAEAGRSELAYAAMMRAARALAASAVDLLVDRELLEEVRREFAAATKDAPYESPLPPGRRPFDFIKIEN